MSDLITRTARLVPYVKRPKQASGLATAYYYEPSADDPAVEYGNLYVVMEILVSGRASDEIARIITDTLTSKYYDDTDVTKPDDPVRFELAVKAVNAELGEHVDHGNAAWIGKLSAVMAVQTGATLHLAWAGSAEAFLYRDHSAARVTAGTRPPATPSKTFGSIATGQLEAGDRVLLATPALIHQIPLTRLQSVVTETSPNTAMAEITNLLHGIDTSRIATLIIEVTTPELAALRVRSEDPSEVQLGAPETPLEAARLAAAPLAQNTITSGRRIAKAVAHNERKLRPHLRKTGLGLAKLIRKCLSRKSGRLVVLAGIITLAAVAIFAVARMLVSGPAGRELDQYNTAFSQVQGAQSALTAGNVATAKTDTGRAQAQVNALVPNRRSLDNTLAQAHLKPGEPTTLAAMQALTSKLTNQLANIDVVSPTTVAKLGNAHGEAKNFEIAGNQAYLFDSANHNALSIVNLGSGSIKPTSTNTSRLGNITATTLAGDGSGIYILTSTPAVWFYSFSGGSLNPVTIAYSSWPQAHGIASYLGSLYLLTDTGVYKYLKTQNGFTPGAQDVTVSGNTASESTALAIDGSIYIASPKKLSRYLAGTLERAATLPAGLTQLNNLRTTPDGSVIIGVDQTTGRIGVWTATVTGLSFDKQIVLSSGNMPYNATYSATAGAIYATTGNRIIKLRFQP